MLGKNKCSRCRTYLVIFLTIVENKMIVKELKKKCFILFFKKVQCILKYMSVVVDV